MHIGAPHSELQLSLTDFDKLAAPLDECLDLCKYGIQAEVPLLGVLLSNGRCHLIVDLPPLASAGNRVLQVLNALLHIAIQHIVHVDLLLASFNDFIADFVQQP